MPPPAVSASMPSELRRTDLRDAPPPLEPSVVVVVVVVGRGSVSGSATDSRAFSPLGPPGVPRADDADEAGEAPRLTPPPDAASELGRRLRVGVSLPPELS